MIKLSIKKHKETFIKLLAAATALAMFSCFAMVCWLTPQQEYIVHAESIHDEYEDYLDATFGEGSTALAELIAGNVPGLNILAAVSFGLEFVEIMNDPDIPVNSISSLQGAFYYQGSRHISTTLFQSGSYYADDGGAPIALSDVFDIRYNFPSPSQISVVYPTMIEKGNYWYADTEVRYGVTISNDSLDVTTNSSIFSNVSVALSSGTYFYKGVCYSKNTIPQFSDNMANPATYIANSGISVTHYIAGGFSDPYYDWHDMGFSDSVSIDSDNIFDFYLETFNPWIVEEYPDLQPYLFVPTVDPTDTTGASGGCCCDVDVYVDVTAYFDPTINVYVTEYIDITNNIDVHVDFPSEWATDVTEPSNNLAHDTINFSNFSEEPTFPELDSEDIEEYKQEFGDGIQFWFALAKKFIETMHLEVLTSFAFLLAIIGFVLWRTGGGGKSD